MNLLYTLYKIPSVSKHEELMVSFIVKYIKDHIPTAKVDVDSYNNVYVTKGVSKTYPVIVAHTDTVHKINNNITVVSAHNIAFGYDFINGGPTGIGADDKNGIYIALRALRHFDVIKIAFFVQEEIGCLGSAKANMEFFNDARFVLQADRRGNSDFINCANATDLCTKTFITDCHLSQFGYKCCNGLSTDVMKLKQRGLKVCCANISCGYYKPHSENEYVRLRDLDNCWNFIKFIIENCTIVYKHTYISKKQLSDTKFVYDYSQVEDEEMTKAIRSIKNYLLVTDNPDFYHFWKHNFINFPSLGYYYLSELYKKLQNDTI